MIPLRAGGRTIGAVLDALAAAEDGPEEILVVDDGSVDDGPAIARASGAVVIDGPGRSAGGARNAGWEAASADVILFLDADEVPQPGLFVALRESLQEFPGALVSGGRRYAGGSTWGWVAHLQSDTVWLPRGAPHERPTLASYCLAVPRDLPIRFDESYGGEDALFCADARALGSTLVFDPRFSTSHNHGRDTFAALRRAQERRAFGMARCAQIPGWSLERRMRSRLPIQYFSLVRLVAVYARVRGDPELRRRFVVLLPRLVVAEFTLGWSALAYAWRRPQLRSERRLRSDGEPNAGG